MNVNADRARAYIHAVRWRFAKTMPQWPHEYTVRHGSPELDAEFCHLVDLIRSAGVCKPWPPEPARPRYHHTYLELDGWEYWTMGEAITMTTVINRARLSTGAMGESSPADNPGGSPTTIAGPATSQVREHVRDRF